MEILSNPITFPILSMLILTLINKSSSPIMIGITLMLFTINIVIMTSKLIKSSILSYITFLMVIGGLLVIFLYFLSLSPKSSLIPPSLISVKTSIKLMITIVFIIMILSSINSNISLMYEFNPINIEYTPMSNKPLSPDYSFHNMYYSMKNSTLIAMTYLFLTMIIVVKMCISFNKPLRQMKKSYE